MADPARRLEAVEPVEEEKLLTRRQFARAIGRGYTTVREMEARGDVHPVWQQRGESEWPFYPQSEVDRFMAAAADKKQQARDADDLAMLPPVPLNVDPDQLWRVLEGTRNQLARAVARASAGEAQVRQLRMELARAKHFVAHLVRALVAVNSPEAATHIDPAAYSGLTPEMLPLFDGEE